MEQQNTIQICDKCDTLLTNAFLHFLKTNNIKTDGIVILNPECSTGVLSNELAKKADRVHGFDSNEHVINFACKKYNLKNLSFEHCQPTKFTSPRLFNLAVINSYIDYIEDKKETFQHINDCLPTGNGELFITVSTCNNKEHPRITVAKKMTQKIQKYVEYLDESEIISLIIPPYPSIQELHTMLEETNFEIIKSEAQSCNLIVTEQQLTDMYKAIIMNLPIYVCIPDDSKEDFTTQYIKEYISTLRKTSDAKLLEPVITTVIHARKIKNLS
jgi:trans-aconitate methyltransferase